MTSKPKLHAAHALSAGRFCAAYYELDRDVEMRSLVLLYDGTQEHPWRWQMFNGHVESICSHGDGYAALTDEGQVFHLMGDEADVETIVGAGYYNEHSTGRGLCYQIADIAERLHVIGDKGQFYRKNDDGSWAQIKDAVFDLEPGFESIRFHSIRGHDNKTLLTATSYPSQETRPELQAKINAAKKARDLEAYSALTDQEEKEWSERKMKGCIFFFDGAEWEELSVAEEEFPARLHLDVADDRYFMGTDQGVLYGGDPDVGFDEVTTVPEAVRSITTFGERIVFTTSFKVYHCTDDPDRLNKAEVLKVPVGKATPAPLKVQGVDGVLFYFDYRHGIHILDADKTWTEVKVLEALLAKYGDEA